MPASDPFLPGGVPPEVARRENPGGRPPMMQQSATAQKDSARLWRAVFENSAIGIGLLNAEGRFTETNSALRQMIGSADLEGISLADLSPLEERSTVMANLVRVREGSQMEYRREHRYRRSDATFGWMKSIVSAVPETALLPRMFVGIFDDVTSHKKAQEEQKKLAALVENSTDFIGMASPDGRVLFINPAGRAAVGLGAEEDVSRRRISDFFVDAELGRVRDEIMPRLQRDGHWEGEASFRNFRTGASVPVWHHGFLVAEPGGHQTIALGTVSRDLSERKRAEERIEAAQIQLAHMARVATMGELAAAITHEVNQPLAAVVANANACMRWLTRDEPDMEEARASAARIVTEARRASDILTRIRGLMERRPARMEMVDLTEIVRQVVDLLQTQLFRGGISLRTEIASDVPLIRGDAVQLQQAIQNLIRNAIDATAERPRGQREIVLSSQRLPPAGISVAVRDTGVGIDLEHLDQLFTPFYTTKTGGLGVGLSIARSIIEAHGGRLWASRNESAGSTFHFSIPSQS
jgi:PAS domain S-box-containing protein